MQRQKKKQKKKHAHCTFSVSRDRYNNDIWVDVQRTGDDRNHIFTLTVGFMMSSQLYRVCYGV